LDERFARKSRYAAGGVIGVLWGSSILISTVGDDMIGVLSSEGKVAEAGVSRVRGVGLVMIVVMMKSSERPDPRKGGRG